MATTHPDNNAYGRLTDRDAILAYMFAGNATFTLVSKRTGQRYTYRVKSAPLDRSKNWSTNNMSRDTFFVSVLMGFGDDSTYRYMGEIRRGDEGYRYVHGRKSSLLPQYKSVQGLVWALAAIQTQPENFENGIEFWHEGKCGRCGRKLTVPESIERGIGPECEGKE